MVGGGVATTTTTTASRYYHYDDGDDGKVASQSLRNSDPKLPLTSLNQRSSRKHTEAINPGQVKENTQNNVFKP